MSTLANIEWEPCLLEPIHDPDVEKRVRRALGRVPEVATYFLDVPWMVDAVIRLDHSKLPVAYVERPVSDLIGLVVSQENSCRYCYAITHSIMRILGFSERHIHELEDSLHTGEISSEDRTALDLARRVARANPLLEPSATKPLRRAGYSDEQVRELVFLAVLHCLYNRLATLPALPPQAMERLPSLWYVRFFRPLMALYVKRLLHTRGKPESLAEADRHGPFAEFVNALDGLPAAILLRRTIDDAWASPILSRRVKALVFAVVARGLGCICSEREALRLLAAEGLEEEEARQILANMGSPGLEPMEETVLPFARETIWYRPAAIQRHARELRKKMSRPQFVELIGIASLANSICRLSAILDGERVRGFEGSRGRGV